MTWHRAPDPLALARSQKMADTVEGLQRTNRQLVIAWKKSEAAAETLRQTVKELEDKLDTAIDRLRRAKAAYDEKCAQLEFVTTGQAPLMARCEEQGQLIKQKAQRIDELVELTAQQEGDLAEYRGLAEVAEQLRRKVNYQAMQISKFEMANK